MIDQNWLDKCLATESSSSSISVDETLINYKTWGNPSNPIIFLVHGYSANSNWWDFIAPHFCNNYYVVAIDLSGMGDSDHRDLYSQDQYSKEILYTEHFEYFVFGHRHLPLDIKLLEKSRYINLGEWINYYSYGVLDQGHFELKFFESAFSKAINK